MSSRYATSCAGKKHYHSPRRAQDAAKASQIKFGIPMNAYPCEYHPGKWVIGSTYPWNSKSERRKKHAEKEGDIDNVE
jgi:hypothetical protein